jgi:hypothetical protein
LITPAGPAAATTWFDPVVAILIEITSIAAGPTSKAISTGKRGGSAITA